MEWLPVTAFVISVVALGLSGFNTWVQWRNRADKRSAWLSIVETQEVAHIMSGRSIFRTVWTLHNAGEGAVMSPTVAVTLSDGERYDFECHQPLLGNSAARVTPMRHLPSDEYGLSTLVLAGATGVATWRDPKGRPRSLPVSVVRSAQ